MLVILLALIVCLPVLSRIATLKLERINLNNFQIPMQKNIEHKTDLTREKGGQNLMNKDQLLLNKLQKEYDARAAELERIWQEIFKLRLKIEKNGVSKRLYK